MDPIIIREDITAPDGTNVPLRIVVYERYSRPINSMHSLVSPRIEHKWYMVAECGHELPEEEFFGGAMQVFEGVTWARNTMDNDYQPLLETLRADVVAYVAERFPADGVRKDPRADWEDIKIVPLPVDLMDAFQDEIVGSEDDETLPGIGSYHLIGDGPAVDEALPFDGEVNDTDYEGNQPAPITLAEIELIAEAWSGVDQAGYIIANCASESQVNALLNLAKVVERVLFPETEGK